MTPLRFWAPILISLLGGGALSNGWSQTNAWPPFLCAAEGAGKVIEYGRNGSIVWDYPAEMSRDVWRLPNGNILFCYNRDYKSAGQTNASGVIEVGRDKRVVWEFHTTGQVWSCQRMTDGNTLVGAASQGKLLLAGPDGRLVREIRLRNKPGHSCLRNARQLPDGHFLVAEESDHAAREYDANGSLLREFTVPFAPFSAVRLPTGSTIVCGQQQMVELDAEGKTAWSVEGSRFPELGLRWFAGIQVLPNGNIFVCNAGGKVPFFEMTKDKTIAWQCALHQPAYAISHGIHRLDVSGPPLK
jgi:hypothetical protein